MVGKLSVTQFRNFLSREFFFHDGLNLIIGDNGKGKTNILEALCLLSGNRITNADFNSLYMENTDFFSISLEDPSLGEKKIFYDAKISKKSYIINNKKTTKKKLLLNSPKAIIFSPMMMNMMYLSPSLRRDFIDQTLSNCSGEYSDTLKKYKKVLVNRNKVLKNISIGRSQKSELQFWDDAFTSTAVIIYTHRENFINYIKSNIELLHEHLKGKILGLNFSYKSKITLDSDYSSQIKALLLENQEKDIIMRSSSFGPHRDDFVIETLDGKDITSFASRGEIKTLILGLKKLEISFTEKCNTIKPILIVDDLLSELDNQNQQHFLSSISDYQVFVTSISPIDTLPNNTHTITLS